MKQRYNSKSNITYFGLTLMVYLVLSVREMWKNTIECHETLQNNKRKKIKQYKIEKTKIK